MAKRSKSAFERLGADRLNRKQKRELSQRVAAGDPKLSIVHPHAGASMQAMIRMTEWFVACRIDTVAVQAAGVYWIALDEILTRHNIRVVLVNARNTKNVPGRKTDVQECQWLDPRRSTRPQLIRG